MNGCIDGCIDACIEPIRILSNVFAVSNVFADGSSGDKLLTKLWFNAWYACCACWLMLTLSVGWVVAVDVVDALLEVYCIWVPEV